MKARHRKSGGKAAVPVARDNASKIEGEAKARKSGGKAVDMHGVKPRANGGRTQRKSGGRTGSNMNPLSSAASGTAPKGHKVKIG
jgi:hypothetical protein